MSRVQLALNVSDLGASIAFYEAMFGVAPAKVRPGYANFEVADPPLKLVLFEGDENGTINHLGVEHFSVDDVTEAVGSARAAGLAVGDQHGTSCCYAVQDKAWIHGPDSAWEHYVVLGDAGNLIGDAPVPARVGSGECC